VSRRAFPAEEADQQEKGQGESHAQSQQADAADLVLVSQFDHNRLTGEKDGAKKHQRNTNLSVSDGSVFG
jgi:hypothetical protein